LSVAAPERPTVPPLTPEQRRAVSLRDRDVFCEAGAGSGKTRVLVERYRAAVADDGVPIDRVLAFTFTERAATELRSRIRATLLRRGRAALAAGDRDRGYELIDLARASERGWVMTIHGFCRRLLAARPAVVGLDPRFRVLDEAEAGRLRDRAIAEALADLAARDRAAARALAAYRPRRFADMVTAAYTRLRSQGMAEPRLPEIGDPRASRPDGSDAADELTPAELAAARDAAGTLEGALERFARRYDELKAARGGLDFADLELRAVAMLEDETAGAGWRGRFDHILVDEFQDTNSVQVRLVEALRGPATRLFAVGDENQSIYRFRNAELEVFRAERARAEADPATEILPLRGNFRSVPGVLGAVNALGEALLDRFMPLEAGRPATPGEPGAELLLTLEDGPDETWGELEDALEPPSSETSLAVVAEARALASRLGELVFGGAADRGDIVILLRAFTHVDAYEEALERAGLRPYVVGGRGYWSQQQVEDVVRLLAAIANPLDDELLLGALASPACGASPDSLWLLRRSAGEGRHLWPALVRAFGGAEAPEPDGDGGDPAPLAAIPDPDAERLRRFCATLAPLRAAAPVVPLEELVERTIVAFGYDLAFLAKPRAPGRMANVRKLERLAREFEQHEGRDLAGFLAAATASARRDEREGMAALAAEEHDGVRVMTVHAAKGLEFPVVAVPDLGRSLDAGHRWGDVVIAAPGGDRRFGMRLAFPAARSRGLWELDALGRAERDAEVAESCRLVHVAATRATERLILSGCFKPPMLEPAEPRPSDSAIRRLLPVLRARGWNGADDEVELPAPAPVAGSAANGAGASSVALAIRVNRPSVERAATLAARARSDAAATEALGGPPPLIEGRPRQVPVGHLSYSALSTYESCGYRFYAERVLGLGSPPTPASASAGFRDAGESADPAEEVAREADELVEPGRDRAQALAFGAAVHAGLEWSARHGWTEPPRDLLASLVAGDASAERAAALIAGWLGSPLGAEVRASRARPEVPFALPLADTVVRGKIDLLLDGGGQRRTVVDFKTDRLAGRSAAELGRRYAIQRLVYALAAAKPEAAATVRAIHVFLEEPGEPVVEELGPLELAAARERVGALIARIRAAEFAPAPDPEPALCFGCPAAANLCPNAAWRPPRR
jgi:ATP-dependent exoDNAse (exonuclease V) beta subunit